MCRLGSVDNVENRTRESHEGRRTWGKMTAWVIFLQPLLPTDVEKKGEKVPKPYSQKRDERWARRLGLSIATFDGCRKEKGARAKRVAKPTYSQTDCHIVIESFLLRIITFNLFVYKVPKGSFRANK